ncbi:hypothetical protein GCM10023321_17800 [Pseudonocardia eucalypti]|uniref:GyrI-like small molecule binding domain-containing protein n=1 Tax=Pseudonocardia eucalypti TaxID=648755 RepID=A0ABP9PV09_9PSEU
MSIGELAHRAGVSVRMPRIQPLPAPRLAQVSGAANDTSEIPAMVDTLISRLAATGIGGNGIRTYHGRPDGSKIDVAVGVTLDAEADPPAGLELARLPAEERAAVVTHGTADDDGDPWLTVDAALAERGLESYGVYRQVHVRGEGEGRPVVELQCPVRDSGCRTG